MKSQTLQTWLHATALCFALATLGSAVFVSFWDIQGDPNDDLDPVGDMELVPPDAEISGRWTHSESARERSEDGSGARRALLVLRARSLAQVAPPKQLAVQAEESQSKGEFSVERAIPDELGVPEQNGDLEIRQSGLVALPPFLTSPTHSTGTSSFDGTVDQVVPSEIAMLEVALKVEGPQWLRGDGMILGWDGSRCITAGVLENTADLIHPLASIPTIARSERAEIALVNYTEKSIDSESYEDSDLWESDQDTSSSGGGGTGGAKQPEAIGVPPPRPQPQFLRDTSVLLDPGEYQFEYGVSYTTNSQTTAIGINVNDNTLVTSLKTLTRTATVPIEFRVGCRNDTQAFVSLPFGYNLQQISIANTADSNDGIGVGDLTFGCTRVLRKPQPEKFTILGNISASAPTGLAQLSSIQQVPGVALGSGYWTLSGGMVFIKTIDPIAAFVGLNYVNTFESTINNLDLQPGNIFSYRFGVGYAINSRVTVSSSFNGAYISELEVGRQLLPGSAREPLTVRIAATILSKGPSLVGQSKGRRRTTEPFIAMGVTDAAPDTNFGVKWTY